MWRATVVGIAIVLSSGCVLPTDAPTAVTVDPCAPAASKDSMPAARPLGPDGAYVLSDHVTMIRLFDVGYQRLTLHFCGHDRYQMWFVDTERPTVTPAIGPMRGAFAVAYAVPEHSKPLYSSAGKTWAVENWGLPLPRDDHRPQDPRAGPGPVEIAAGETWTLLVATDYPELELRIGAMSSLGELPRHVYDASLQGFHADEGRIRASRAETFFANQPDASISWARQWSKAVSGNTSAIVVSAAWSQPPDRQLATGEREESYEYSFNSTGHSGGRGPAIDGGWTTPSVYQGAPREAIRLERNFFRPPWSAQLTYRITQTTAGPDGVQYDAAFLVLPWD